MKTEWIELGLPYWCYDEQGESFESLGLNKPGTLIDVEDKIYLIGHINLSCGVCDDCTEFEYDAIVKRYKVIWEEDNGY